MFVFHAVEENQGRRENLEIKGKVQGRKNFNLFLEVNFSLPFPSTFLPTKQENTSLCVSFPFYFLFPQSNTPLILTFGYNWVIRYSSYRPIVQVCFSPIFLNIAASSCCNLIWGQKQSQGQIAFEVAVK